MKLTLAVHRYAPAVSGSEVYFTNLAENLARRGHEVTVVTSDLLDWEGHARYRPRQELRRGVKVRRLPYLYAGERNLYRVVRKVTRRGPLSALFFDPVGWKVLAALLQTNTDVIHATCLPRACVTGSIVAARLRHTPVVVTPLCHFHAPDFMVAAKSAIPLLRHCARVLVCTQAERAGLRQCGIPDRLLTTIGVGFHFTRVQETETADWRMRLGMPAQAFTAAFAAASIDIAGKGIREVIAASRRLTDVHFIFMGGSAAEWNRIYERDLPGVNCHYVGFVSEEAKYQLLKASDVFVMPSVCDSFGIVYMEAMAAGKPVITANTRQMVELYADVGINIPHGSTDALVAAI